MSVTKNNKILASDVSTALNNKQDKLNYTPVKSVNGDTPDSAGNVDIDTGLSIWESGAYADGSQWYRKYSDGWIEQGGTTTSNNVEFILPFKDTNYTVTCTPYSANRDIGKTGHFFAVTKTPNGMTRTYTSIQVDWMARGYGEE